MSAEPERNPPEVTGSSILRDAGGAVVFGFGLLLLAAGLLLVVLGATGAGTVVGRGLPPLLLGVLAFVAGVALAITGLVSLYRRLTRR
jgi:hypothetical protein